MTGLGCLAVIPQSPRHCQVAPVTQLVALPRMMYSPLQSHRLVPLKPIYHQIIILALKLHIDTQRLVRLLAVGRRRWFGIAIF